MPCMEYVPFFDQIPQAMEGLDWAEEVEFVKVNMAGTMRVKNYKLSYEFSRVFKYLP